VFPVIVAFPEAEFDAPKAPLPEGLVPPVQFPVIFNVPVEALFAP
jgi:hypothetical protein